MPIPSWVSKRSIPSGRVAQAMRLCGVDAVHTGIGKTGVVAVIKGKTDTRGRMIGLRADMDALAHDWRATTSPGSRPKAA
jgi:metal-dependent amidase/aminoacylase/carboxypeptidase family protein